MNKREVLKVINQRKKEIERNKLEELEDYMELMRLFMFIIVCVCFAFMCKKASENVQLKARNQIIEEINDCKA